MRRIMTGVLAVAIGAGMLSACSPSPNQDAIDAAAVYADALAVWAQELSTAAGSARTATTAEWEAAGEGELGFEEVGIGDVLASAPELESFDAGAVEHTPSYRIALRVADRISAITVELEGLEPESLERLRQAAYDAYWVTADLYYNTLGGPATDRLDAQTESYDLLDDLPAFYKLIRESGLDFAIERRALVEVAIEELGGTVDDEDRPIVPESPLGTSIGTFMVEWLAEEVSFQDAAIAEIEQWTTIAAPFNDFWGYGNLNVVFAAPADHAAQLRPAFVALAVELADALASAGEEPAAELQLPAVGDPYRQALLDGYLPWGDPAASQDRSAQRLWMLWRIRELDDVADAAYLAARVALLEEFNRSVAEEEAIDFRPGAGRLLAFVDEQTQWFTGYTSAAGYERMVAALHDVQGYGEVLREYPMTAEVGADFDAVLELSAQLIADMDEVTEQGTTAFSAISELVTAYLEQVEDAASRSLSALDDDAQAEQLLATAIEGTAP